MLARMGKADDHVLNPIGPSGVEEEAVVLLEQTSQLKARRLVVSFDLCVMELWLWSYY